VALARPIVPPGAERPVGIIIVGVSPRLPLQESYRDFCEQVVASVTTAVANARAYEQERERAEALAEIDRAKTQFFSNVSHEFRTPLTLMLGPLEDELAERFEPLPPARRERLQTVHRNSLRLLKLVNTLLDFSRLEAGRAQASYEATDLAAYTVELASTFRSAIEKAGLTLTEDCPSLPEPIYVDREMWEKIVLNLLSNAFKHTFEGGIRVTFRCLGDYVELAVADSGVGIPQEARSRLFERFQRVKEAKSRTHEGTGIGLALVRELVGLHGGLIRLDGEVGKGSTFTVTVKAGTAHLPPDRICAPRAPGTPSTSAAAYVEEAKQWLPSTAKMPPDAFNHFGVTDVRPGLKATDVPRPRIIWADDNADMREYVRRLLADSFEVLAVPDGLAALACAQDKVPDLVLTDIMMPGLDGLGLLHELRKGAHTQTVPVILLSARAGEESSLEGLEAGADDYVVKPFSARELLARIRTHLELARIRRAWANELEQANKELEAFSYSVSHDLRAPLRAIDGFSKLILDEYGQRLGQQAVGYLSRILAGTQKMSELIDDLLNLTQIGRTPLLKEQVDLTKLARGAVDELRQREPVRQVTTKIAEALSANADRRLLRIVLDNLLGNAWKYTGKCSEARIVFTATAIEENKTAFCIRDNGAGFDMAYADKLFAPFQRLHPDSEFPGTGIGLAIVQRIVARHGGRIWAEAAVGQGAAFFFTLGGTQ
jgi:signal transduction histidine kinase